MIQRAIWFERKFTFDLPVWMFPNVVERLRGTPARLEDRLRDVPRELLTRKDGDAWTMQEHIGHLLDLGELDAGRLDDYDTGLERLRAADLKNRKTYEANHNANTIERLLAEFRAERGRFVRRLDELDEAAVLRTAIHPRLDKPMRLLDLTFFIAEHDDHHVAAVTELMRKYAG